MEAFFPAVEEQNRENEIDAESRRNFHGALEIRKERSKRVGRGARRWWAMADSSEFFLLFFVLIGGEEEEEEEEEGERGELRLSCL